MRLQNLCLFAIIATVFIASPSEGTNPPVSLTDAERDSLVALGEEKILNRELDLAIEIFTRLTQSYPNDAYLRIRLGYAHLSNANYKAAEAAYEKAKELNPDLPEAYVGVGLTYAERPARGMGALQNFRKALGEAKRATKIDSTYSPAYRLLGELYERFRDDHEKAIKYYLKYVEKEPDNPDGLYYFGLACIQAKRFDLIEQYLAPYLVQHPGETRLISQVAQGFFYLEKYERALAMFERHLLKLDETERAHYTDISLVASEKERHAFALLEKEEERLAYLHQFWRRRDPDILTAINERIIEHYRRVWFARTFFSTKVYPWDRRGEVYIRFGEPDYRSRSDNREFIISPEVEAVRTQMAVDLYGPQAAYLTFIGPVFPIRTRRDPFSTTDSPPEVNRGDIARLGTSDANEEDIELDALDPIDATPGATPRQDQSITDRSGNPISRMAFDSYAPVTVDGPQESVPWETWTYTKLQNGVEFTFTDEVGRGDFDFAPLPPRAAGDDKLKKAVQLIRYTPGVIYQKAVAKTPDFYRPDIRADALGFYYDLADFRGENGQTQLEVYYGVPPAEVEISQTQKNHLIHVQGTLALADEEHTHIYRTEDVFTYQKSNGFDERKGAFVPDLLKLEVPPGKYQLQVQLKDVISGRVGVYKQNVDIHDYSSDQLKISGIQLALAIEQEGKNARLRKDDIWVIPHPSRTYGSGTQVFAYFEIYNLERDKFGQTRYKVQYQIKFSSQFSSGVASAISSGLRALLQRKRPEVSIAYDQVGSNPVEKEYVELNLQKAKPGVNILQVTITDEVSKQKDTREVMFVYGVTPEK